MRSQARTCLADSVNRQAEQETVESLNVDTVPWSNKTLSRGRNKTPGVHLQRKRTSFAQASGAAGDTRKAWSWIGRNSKERFAARTDARPWRYAGACYPPGTAESPHFLLLAPPAPGRSPVGRARSFPPVESSARGAGSRRPSVRTRPARALRAIHWPPHAPLRNRRAIPQRRPARAANATPARRPRPAAARR